jgi:CubicO group peptidase (beta-lactamase class C family)
VTGSGQSQVAPDSLSVAEPANVAQIAPARIDALFDWVKPGGPGCAIGIYRHGEPAILRAYGLANIEQRVPITADTVFHIASLSKQVTAFCAALLAERGLLELDARLGEFLPELQAGGDISLRQILHHVSGLRDQWGLLDLAGWRHEDLKTTGDIVRLATRQRALNFAPGSRFQYINTGYTLIGTIIEQITGQSLRDFASEQVFEPLGMTRTHFHDDVHRVVPGRADAYDDDETGALRVNNPAYATAGPTGLFTTVADFGLWERHLSFPQICSSELIAEMHRRGTLGTGQSTGYGYGLALGTYRGLRIAEHAGGDAAFRAHFLRFPDHQLAIAIFCNTPAAPPGKLARQIAEIFLADTFSAEINDGQVTAAQTSRATGIMAPDGDALLGYCGRYREPGGHDLADIVYRDGRLFLASPSGPDYELVALGQHRFAFAGLDATCLVEPSPDKPMRFRTFYGGTETAMLEAVAPEAAATLLAEEDYSGRYVSDELDIAYDVQGNGPALMLSRGKRGTHPLTPLSIDQFACSGGLSIRFCRNAVGAVDAMEVSTERVWHVRFRRDSDQSSATSGQPGPSMRSPSR